MDTLKFNKYKDDVLSSLAVDLNEFDTPELKDVSSLKFMTQYLSGALLAFKELSCGVIWILALTHGVCVCRTEKCFSLHRNLTTSQWQHLQNKRLSRSWRRKRQLPSRPSEPPSPRLGLTPEVNRSPAAVPAFLFPPDLPPGLIWKRLPMCFKRKRPLHWWSLTLSYFNKVVVYG